MSCSAAWRWRGTWGPGRSGRLDQRPDRRACQASELGRTAWTEGVWPGTVTVLLANASDGRAGSGQAGGERRPVPVEPPDAASAGPATRDPVAQEPATIDPGEAARIDLELTGRCTGPMPHGVPIGYHDVQVIVLGRSVPVTNLEVPRDCTVRIGRWYVLPPMLYTPWVSASIAAPGSVRRGQDLRYVVTLRTESGNGLSLSPCPAYLQRFAGRTTAYRLNCSGAGSLGGHRSVRLEMVLRVPEQAPPGAERLNWTLVMPDGHVTVADLAVGGVPVTVEP